MTEKLISLSLKESNSLAISNKFMLSIRSLCVCKSMTWFSRSCVSFFFSRHKVEKVHSAVA